MRIILLTTANHIYGNYLLKQVISARRDDIIAVIESSVLIHNKSFPKAIIKYLKTSGVYYVLAQAIKQEYFVIGSTINRLLGSPNVFNIFFPYRRLAATHGIPKYKLRNINHPDAVSLLNVLKPDLLVSIFFNQILGNRVINMPSLGCINIHPAYLPQYRGVSPTFWTLANGEQWTGVTVHYIDRGIDTGKILAQQKIRITSEDSEHSLYMRCCCVGTELLLDAIRNIELEMQSPPAVSDKKCPSGSYFSFPTKQAVSQFRRNGRVFFRISEFHRKT